MTKNEILRKIKSLSNELLVTGVEEKRNPHMEVLTLGTEDLFIVETRILIENNLLASIVGNKVIYYNSPEAQDAYKRWFNSKDRQYLNGYDMLNVNYRENDFYKDYAITEILQRKGNYLKINSTNENFFNLKLLKPVKKFNRVKTNILPMGVFFENENSVTLQIFEPVPIVFLTPFIETYESILIESHLEDNDFDDLWDALDEKCSESELFKIDYKDLKYGKF